MSEKEGLHLAHSLTWDEAVRQQKWNVVGEVRLSADDVRRYSRPSDLARTLPKAGRIDSERRIIKVTLAFYCKRCSGTVEESMSKSRLLEMFHSIQKGAMLCHRCVDQQAQEFCRQIARPVPQPPVATEQSVYRRVWGNGYHAGLRARDDAQSGQARLSEGARILLLVAARRAAYADVIRTQCVPGDLEDDARAIFDALETCYRRRHESVSALLNELYERSWLTSSMLESIRAHLKWNGLTVKERDVLLGHGGDSE